MTRPRIVSEQEIVDLGFGTVVARDAWDQAVRDAKFSDSLHAPKTKEPITADVSRLDSIEPTA